MVHVSFAYASLPTGTPRGLERDMSIPPSSPFTFTLAGAGCVGTAVAVLLARAGHMPVGTASRSAGSAERAAGLLGAEAYSVARLPPADVVLVGAPDDAIAEVAGLVPAVRGSVVWHFAGSRGLGPLEPALSRGALGAALHPVQACPSIEAATLRLPGSAWGVTCSDELREWAQVVITGDLRGIPITVASKDRPAWHASSVITANGISALLSAGERVLGSIGVDDPIAVLGPIAAGVIANAREAGGATATLTGPVVRGEVAVIERHLAALEGTEGRAPYATATRMIIAAAVASGRIDNETAAKMSALLGDER